MEVSQQKVVSVHYKLNVFEGEGSEEVFVEETEKSQPLVFLMGSGQLLPAFEAQLNGLSVNAAFDFVLTPEEGYGESSPENVVKLPLDAFVADGETLDTEMIASGNFVPMVDESGHQFQGLVLEVNSDGVLMDFNHPLAGKHLHFTGTVNHVRAATLEELSHGHVHGEGGIIH